MAINQEQVKKELEELKTNLLKVSEPQLKEVEEFNAVCKELKTSPNTVLSALRKLVIRNKKIPFDIPKDVEAQIINERKQNGEKLSVLLEKQLDTINKLNDDLLVTQKSLPPTPEQQQALDKLKEQKSKLEQQLAKIKSFI